MTENLLLRLVGNQDDGNNDQKNGAIPHTFGAYDHVTEVDYVPGKCTWPDQSP